MLLHLFSFVDVCSSKSLCRSCCEFVAVLLEIDSMPAPACYRRARSSGVYPEHYLTINMTTTRDSESWWVELTTDCEKATKWNVEREDHVLKIWCEMAGHTPVFLTAHGPCRGGCAESIGPDCFAALVHRLDDENALWIQQVVDTQGTSILRKAKATNAGYALTGLCFPEKLHRPGYLRGDVANGFWKALPYVNVVVQPTTTVPCLDQHVLWTFIPVHGQDDISIKM